VVARDGVDALDYLYGQGAYTNRNTSEMPRLILLDLKMPRMDGLHVLERLRADERTRFTPVVILTSSKEEQDLINSYKSGANSYVRKPVDFNEFLEAVRNIGLYWLLINENAAAN
jgi:two-component system response regulator